MLIEEYYRGYVIAKANYANKPSTETEIMMLDALESYLKEAHKRIKSMKRDSNIKAEQSLIKRYFKG